MIRTCESIRNKISPYLEWTTTESCGAPSLCVQPAAEKPFCVLLATQPDLCKGHEGAVCDGDVIDTCHEGWIVKRQDCPPANATCAVVEQSPSCQPNPDPACDGKYAFCEGSELVICQNGRIAARSSCKNCHFIPVDPAPDASHELQSECGYLLGDPCVDSADCEEGLSCLNQTCTLSCTVRAGFSDYCEAELSDPFNRAWYTKPDGAAPLQSGACIDGICVWK